MSSNKINTAVLAMVAVLAGVAPALGQAPLGTRAQGMAGAFVGVADDASAVYWNPSGLATGAFVSAILMFGEEETAPDGAQPLAGERHTGSMVALSLPPVGIAYYRLGAYGTAVSTSAVNGLHDREEVRRSVQALATSTFGVSLLQSIGEFVVVGATPKVVWGSAALGDTSMAAADDALSYAADLDREGSTRFDVDASVMMAVGHIRAGLVGRNLTAPSFDVGADGPAIVLEREARVGAAWGSGWPGLARVVISADADLLARPTPLGDRRDVAAGVETWWLGQALGLRGGVRGSTLGDARAAVAAGLSYALRPGLYVEAHVMRGDGDGRGWSVGARFGF